eukprot:Rmarinus@m.15680
MADTNDGVAYLKAFNLQSMSNDEYVSIANGTDDDFQLGSVSLVSPYSTHSSLATTPRNEVDNLQLEILVLKENLDSALHDQRATKRELDRVLTEFQELRTDYDADVSRLQTTVATLKKDLSAEKQKCIDDKEKAEKFEEARRQAERAEHECTSLRQRIEDESAAMRAFSSERDELKQQVADARKQVELLTLDKSYLTKQVDTLLERAQRADATCEEARREAMESKRQREEVYEKLTALNDQQRTTYEERLASELEKIREKASKDLEKIHESSRSMYERELDSVRRARDEALEEVKRTTTQLADLQHRYDDLVQTMRTTQVTVDSQLGELRSDLKMKVFELERLTAAHAEADSSVTRLRIENEELVAKCEVMRTEYFQLQTQTSQKILELQGLLDARNDKLEAYEQLEKELDEAIINAGQAEAGVPLASPSGGSPPIATARAGAASSSSVLDVLSCGLPSIARRRMKQSVQLAKRVVQLQRENAELKEKLQEESNARQHISSQLHRNKDLLDRTQQPHGYLVDLVKQRDNELAEKDAVVDTLRRDLTSLRDTYEKCLRERNEMETDLRSLLQQQSTLEELKSTLVGMSASKGVPTPVLPPHRDHHRPSSHPSNFPYSSTTGHNGDSGTPSPVGARRDMKPVRGSGEQLQPPPIWFQKLKKMNRT